MSQKDLDAMNSYFRQFICTPNPLKSVERKQHKKPLVEDGVGTTIAVCNVCGKKDCVYPISSIHLCPNCMKGGVWTYGMVKVERSGTCAICGNVYNGAGVYVEKAKACIRCLWSKLGHKRGGLRTDAGRLV